MNAYASFAELYDRLTANVSYAQWAEYYISLYARVADAPMPTLAVDLACGTGSLSCALSARGIDLIGVDASPEMLSVAQQKAAKQGESVLFLNQPMQALDLYGTVDAVICSLDSVNHLVRPEDVRGTFARVSLFLRPGGVFLFDVNTPYKHRKVLANNTFIYDLDSLYCVWQCRTRPSLRLTRMSLDFFVQPEAEESYIRTGTRFFERAYPRRMLASWLGETGFRVADVFAELTTEPPRPKTQRMVFVAVKQ